MKIIPLAENLLTYFQLCLIPFQVFTEDEWSLFSSSFSQRELRKKETLVQVGEVCTDLFFLNSGAIRYYYERDGKLITNYFSFKGELSGSYSSFITGKPSCIGIEALEACNLIVVSAKSLELLSLNPLLSFKLEQMRRKIAEYMILCYEDRVLSFLTRSPEERYLQLLNTNTEILQRIPQHFIAHYLGITPVSLSRIRNRSRSISA